MPDALVGWAEIYDPAWKPSFLRQQANLAVMFAGQCPNCSHQTMFSVPLARPDVSTEALRGAATFTMFCECGYPHPGHPDGDNSCGAYWPYEAEL
ncbi:MAG TPA: hypothetical protein VHZ03_23105 [Trebonia sp.]|jgi:hypothetical protein|nr:hypothetical protein [Trebonia sp.]